MKEHSITQKYALGQEVKHNNKLYRVNAFRFEVRPMGNLKVYEISNGEGERAEVEARGVAHELVNLDYWVEVKN